MKRTRMVAVAVIGLGLAGCTKPEEPVKKTVEPKVMTAKGEMKPLGDKEQAIADQAIEVLAEELGIEKDQIAVDTVRPVNWPDTSIGCPQPGQAYGQVITPGHKVSLRVDKTLHLVHEANGKAFVCKNTKPLAKFAPSSVAMDWARPAGTARADLAKKLGVEEKLVVIGGAKRKNWPDASLECPEPGVTYEPKPTKGYVIALRYGGRTYTYHTDLERVVACPDITED